VTVDDEARSICDAKNATCFIFGKVLPGFLEDFRTNKNRGDKMKAADYARMAEECSRKADAMLPSPERDALIEKARQYRSYAKTDNWVASKELRPPG
jgi:hypothetical protein